MRIVTAVLFWLSLVLVVAVLVLGSLVLQLRGNPSPSKNAMANTSSSNGSAPLVIRPPVIQPPVIQPPVMEVPGRQVSQVVAQPESTGLTIPEVMSWCVSNCEHHQFNLIPEGSRTAVQMVTGIAATLNVPAGVSIDGWSCYEDLDYVGPMQWTGCAATFRLI